MTVSNAVSSCRMAVAKQQYQAAMAAAAIQAADEAWERASTVGGTGNLPEIPSFGHGMNLFPPNHFPGMPHALHSATGRSEYGGATRKIPGRSNGYKGSASVYGGGSVAANRTAPPPLPKSASASKLKDLTKEDLSHRPKYRQSATSSFQGSFHQSSPTQSANLPPSSWRGSSER
jgi:hypothetical protein